MKIKFLIFVLCLQFAVFLQAQEFTIPKENQDDIANFLTAVAKKQTHVHQIKIDSISTDKKELHIYVNSSFSHIRFNRPLVDSIYKGIKELLPHTYKKYKLSLFTDGYSIEQYIDSERKERYHHSVRTPLIRNLSKPYDITKGLKNRHIALWQSHGWYYEQKLDRWEWQRARIFQTVEDLYTQSYVLPYLVPMLENAGANVLLPRERDTQKEELIIDADLGIKKNHLILSHSDKEKWQTGKGNGFAHLKEFYVDNDNPFKSGTYQQITSTTDKKHTSSYKWIPSVEKEGNYAIYVSYKTLENSTEDASYTVHHLGGETNFLVNQKMGGGTWIYLGTFRFPTQEATEDANFYIELNNLSKKKGRIITADAVKMGGGMGNIARYPSIEETDKKEHKHKIIYQPQTSTYPRYTEAARYWLQWAGMPDSVYTVSKGKNDYSDDFQSRGFWVNYIAGGSDVLPDKQGLNIPIDLAFAFHSDAGTTYNDSIIGTLGICMTHINNEAFSNGKPRILSRDFTQGIMNEIEQTIRTNYEPDWTMRQIWNKSYAEARVPEVPTMLLELLSHQNFADMRYGLDPNFQFDVSRAIYKGMLKFLAKQYNQPYVVQPLPVNSMNAVFLSENEVKISWKPTIDSLEQTAQPTDYILYTKTNDGDFDSGMKVKGTSITLNIEKDEIYTYKVTALNEGGESFPSEQLSLARKSNEKGLVLIVNGFDRISAPYSFSTSDSIAGFVDAIDYGVPYVKQYNYIGSQKEFRRSIPWMDDDASGFGDSYGNFETQIIAGNTFDYPLTHGKAIYDNGYSFISTSRKAVEQGDAELKIYSLVDLILGKQKQTTIGRGILGFAYKTFTPGLQKAIKNYCEQGGNIFVSGANVGSDLWDTKNVVEEDKRFAEEVLKYKWRVDRAAVDGKIKAVASPFTSIKGNYEYNNKLSEDMYIVESPDAIEPYGKNAYTIFRYSENNLSAGIASDDSYKTLVLGFPFETLISESQRTKLMKGILDFMNNKSND